MAVGTNEAGQVGWWITITDGSVGFTQYLGVQRVACEMFERKGEFGGKDIGVMTCGVNGACKAWLG